MKTKTQYVNRLISFRATLTNVGWPKVMVYLGFKLGSTADRYCSKGLVDSALAQVQVDNEHDNAVGHWKWLIEKSEAINVRFLSIFYKGVISNVPLIDVWCEDGKVRHKSIQVRQTELKKLQLSLFTQFFKCFKNFSALVNMQETL